jgi:hypothetical protein
VQVENPEPDRGGPEYRVTFEAPFGRHSPEDLGGQKKLAVAEHRAASQHCSRRPGD